MEEEWGKLDASKGCYSQMQKRGGELIGEFSWPARGVVEIQRLSLILFDVEVEPLSDFGHLASEKRLRRPPKMKYLHITPRRVFSLNIAVSRKMGIERNPARMQKQLKKIKTGQKTKALWAFCL